MKKTQIKSHKIVIWNRSPRRIMTGASTSVTLDGKPLRGCRSVKFEVASHGIARVTLELYADLKIAAGRVRVGRKFVSVYAVGSYSPIVIIPKRRRS